MNKKNKRWTEYEQKNRNQNYIISKSVVEKKTQKDNSNHFSLSHRDTKIHMSRWEKDVFVQDMFKTMEIFNENCLFAQYLTVRQNFLSVAQ